jgi:hypothetical protein|tara:strand:- start:1062 stop:1742 length:681 start_codon:yes stop_codon:yes gene_type:complete
MALIRTSSLVSDIRGAVGGVVFQGNSAGLIVRNRSTAKNVNSFYQNIQRNVLSSVQKEWVRLSTTQQSAFNSLVHLAKIKQNNIIGNLINGQQLFIKVNSLLLRYNVAIIQDTKLRSLDVENVSVTCRNNAGVFTVKLSRALDFTNELLVFKMSTVIDSSINNSSGRLKLIVFTQSLASTFTITNEVVDVFGVIPESDAVVFVECYIVGKLTALIGSKYKSKIIIE